MKLILVALLFGCEPRDFSSQELAILQGLTDLPDPPPDTSNKYATDAGAIALGKKLFFDPGFSGTSSGKDRDGRVSGFARTATGTAVNLSCASCHDPAAGGADATSQPNEVSIGAGRFNVNAPSLINSVYWETWFWSGQLDSMWSVGAVALEATVAMNSDRLAVAWRLYDVHRAEYEAIFGPLLLDARFPRNGKPGALAYDQLSDDDKEIVDFALVNFAKAIAAYEMQLVVKGSPFDAYMDGANSLSDEAIRGAKLFIGKAACIECHNTPLFSDNGFHNTGVPEISAARPWEAECFEGSTFCDCTNPNPIEKTWCLPYGAHDGFSRFAHTDFHRSSKFSDAGPPGDRPTREVNEALKGAWRTASLRNLAQTAPYMHNGAYQTLEDVVWHYDQGGTSSGSARQHKSPLMQPLVLTQRDVQDLVAFLEALEGEPLPKELTRPDGRVPP